MKNSTIFLLAALLVLATSLTAYNMALRTEYRRGTYQDPLRDFKNLKYSDFDEVDVPAASAVGVAVVRGPFGVRLDPRAAEFVHLRQRGRQLVVEVAFPKEWQYLPGEAVVISCPRLAALGTDADYRAAGRLIVDKERTGGHAVRVQGFGQDTLRLRQDHASRIVLAGNHLACLLDQAGASLGSHSALRIGPTNQIAAAHLTLGHQSQLAIDNVPIADLRCQFADSVQLTLTGAAIGSLVR